MSAGASFTNGTDTATETTNTNGIAVSPRFAANTTAGGTAAALLIGAVSGLLPAIRAARLSPSTALRAT